MVPPSMSSWSSLAIDLAVVVTGGDKRQAAEAIRNIPSDILDLGRKTRPRSLFLPSGTKTVNFVVYEDSLQLVMALGGKQAEQKRAQRHMGSNGGRG